VAHPLSHLFKASGFAPQLFKGAINCSGKIRSAVYQSAVKIKQGNAGPALVKQAC
jgi:hypothetical protein